MRPASGPHVGAVGGDDEGEDEGGAEIEEDDAEETDGDALGLQRDAEDKPAPARMAARTGAIFIAGEMVDRSGGKRTEERQSRGKM